MTKDAKKLLENIAKLVETMFYKGHPLAKQIRNMKDEQ